MNLINFILGNLFFGVINAHILRNLRYSNEIIERFDNWIDNHDIKVYGDEHLVHIFQNWINNDKYINMKNSLNLSYKLDHNSYSGYSFEEFRQIMNFENNNDIIETTYVNKSLENFKYTKNNLESVDWRNEGAVNPVKDQGQCGSCWSFSAIQALESASAIKYGKLYDLSEQELVDCDNISNGGRDHGCSGGLMNNAFTWINKNNGICSEIDYPYISGITKIPNTCVKTCINQDNTDIIKFINIDPNSDTAMMGAISLQPVSIAIEADQRDFQLYSSGIFTGTCGTNLDHGVGLVGYGTDYYILRNSWGSSWGLNGYMLIGKGNDPNTGKPYNNGAGQCGLLMEGSYPIV